MKYFFIEEEQIDLHDNFDLSTAIYFNLIRIVNRKQLDFDAFWQSMNEFYLNQIEMSFCLEWFRFNKGGS